MKKALLLVLIGMLFCAGIVFSQSIPYVGEWQAYTDVNNGGDSTVTMTAVTRDGMPAFNFAGGVTTKYQYGFVGWQCDPDPATLAALKNAKGISFKVLGDGKRYTVKYRTTSVRDEAHHEFHFNTRAGEVQEVTVQMRQFIQPAWGATVRMNQANVINVAFQTHEGWRPGTYNITVWDLRILQ